MILAMDRISSPKRIMLLAGHTAPAAGRGGVEIRRYRLARARLDGRPGFAQRSASDVARSSRSASLPIP
jgi:hypothetical protein